MNLIQRSWRACLAGGALVGLLAATSGWSAIALAQSADASADAMRPEMLTPLREADELIKAGKFPEAMAKIREAEQIADRTPAEAYTINRMRGIIATNMGDTMTAMRSFEAVMASGRSPPAEKVRLSEALAAMYFKAGEYPKAVSWAIRYQQEGGTNPEIRMLQVRGLYLSEDYAGAAKELRAILDADEKAGKTPPFDRLQLLSSAYVKLKDSAGYNFVLEKVLAYYPKKEYWADAITRVASKPGYPDYLQLDALRLYEATGSLTTPTQYTLMAQLAQKSGLPGEAKRVMDLGFASGVLGKGADAEMERKLLDSATRQVADDERNLAQNAKDAGAAKDGTALVNVGYAMVSAGQISRGLELMEQGIQKGGIARPEDARLHLAIAYLAAGRKAKAIETFRAVQGADATADLARLWLIHMQRSSS